jgi:hypothetical protein
MPYMTESGHILHYQSLVTSFNQATGWTTEEIWFDSQQGKAVFLFANVSRLALGLAVGTGSLFARNKMTGV